MFKNSPSAVDDGILMISLCSQVDKYTQKFIKAVSQFIRTADSAFALLYDTISDNPKQMKILFAQFIDLTSTLQKEAYTLAITSIKETLL